MTTASPERRCGHVAIIGRPNVGKSTLLNRLIGQKLAITADKPQTTRHAILGIKTLEQGQIIYLDTPGIHAPSAKGRRAFSHYLNRAATALLPDADVVLFLVEALKWGPEDASILKQIPREKPLVLAVNKVDRIKDKSRLLPFLQQLSALYPFTALIPLSAAKGTQVNELEALLLQQLPPGENLYPEDELTNRSERFFAAELLREQLTRRYSQEIPYALSVEIERFEDQGNSYRIYALVWVERENQKRILIGKGGTALKEAASEARQQMMVFFDKRVHLEVWIKIKGSWADDEAALASLGYTD